MISFWRIFCLELTTLVRTRTVALLLLVSAAWMFLLPFVVTGDGTPDGARELYIRYSVGGVFALLLIALLASATGSLARERAARRLQLTMVRPVRYFAIALGKILAHVAVGAAVLAVAFAILACRTDLTRPCNHVLKPILPTPREEAVRMYDAFMADPATPERVRHARKSVVLRLLENRAVDKEWGEEIFAMNFFVKTDDVTDSMAIDTDLRTWANASAWNLEDGSPVAITEVNYDFDYENIVPGQYQVTFATEGYQYKVSTTRALPEGTEVGLSFDPEDIHLMVREEIPG